MQENLTVAVDWDALAPPAHYSFGSRHWACSECGTQAIQPDCPKGWAVVATVRGRRVTHLLCYECRP